MKMDENDGKMDIDTVETQVDPTLQEEEAFSPVQNESQLVHSASFDEDTMEARVSKDGAINP